MDNYTLERELISQLISCNHEDGSLRSFSKQVLDVLGKHPLLTTSAIWHYVPNNIMIIASHNLNDSVYQELADTPYQSAEYPPLQIHSVAINKAAQDKAFTRLDVSLAKTKQYIHYASFWINTTAIDLDSLSRFLKDAFGIYNLFLSRFFDKKQLNILQTVLNKAAAAVEITNEEAIIQYVNPAFEKITLYQSAEAINKTVASLIRSPKEDLNLFQQIKKELDAGNTWRGTIHSRKKDGSDWIAQTVIVPVMDEESDNKVTQHIAIKQDITEQINQINRLKISEERYRNLMNAASDAIFIHDLQGRIVEVNDAACKSLGYSRKKLIRSYVWDIEVGPSQEALNEIWVELQKGFITLEGRHKRKDGTIFPVDVRLGIFNTTGEKLVMAIVRDITAAKRSEDTIRILTRALEQSPVLVMITDKSGTIEYINAKTIEQTGYSANEIIGKNPRILQSGKTPQAAYQAMWDQLTSGHEWRGELLNKNKQGGLFWVSAIISPLRNEDNEGTTHYLAVMEDISQKKIYEEMLKHQATFDNLTNLPNRFYGYNKLELAISKARANEKGLAILFMDIDDFKQINDSLGHTAGDLLLKALSERYLSIIRQTDTIARLGGDEFMIILENLNHSTDAELIAKKCHDACQEPFHIDSHELMISISIGIALFPDHGKDAKALMRNADTAMYQGKLRGKNTSTVFINTMAEVATNRIRIKSELSQVLTRNELYVCYQPIISLKENKVVAAEALLRWHSPTLGHVMPDQIIPIAEETGLIIPLGYWILKEVCTQIKEWSLLTERKIKIAINISILQLKQKDFVSKVQAILDQAQLSPDSLIFEITESAFIDDSQFILSQLNQLDKMNIHCSLDDFGVGYSSLGYLRTYPFRSLKIDRVFIQGLNTNSNDSSLVNTIISMSKNLKLHVVAEGIETEEQLELIRHMGCDMVQGWYFAKAMCGEDFLFYLNQIDL